MNAKHWFLWFAGAAILAAGCGSDDAGTTVTSTTSASSSSSSTGGGGGAGGASEAPLDVTTDLGPVEGTLLGTTRAFLGIPFAAPPVADLRWKPPQPAAPWTTTLAAKKKGARCPQLGDLTMTYDSSTNEDCLTANVWTPSKPSSESLPVLVWIYGGGFTLGSGDDADYDGQDLSEASGAVVVTFNYRLGPLGYLAMDELSAEDPSHPTSGNYGMLDQRAALAWAKKNAAAFGGDPTKLTVFGESAGGISICHHLVSPNSKGLFSQAIIESGPCGITTSMAFATAQASDFAQAAGCQGADVLACLRSKSAEAVTTALPLPADIAVGPGVRWLPVIDGVEIPDDPTKLIDEGALTSVPTVLGSNGEEGSLFLLLAGESIPDEAAFQAYAEEMAPGHGAEIVAEYPIATYGTAKDATIAALGDGGFVCPTRRLARAMAKTGAPTYLYHFAYAPTGTLLPGLGSFHSSEIRYVFGHPTQLIPAPIGDDEKPLVDAVQGYWSHFAAAGDPNGAGAFAWPKYAAATDEDVVLDAKLSSETGRSKALCDFWDAIPSPAQ